VLGLSSVSCKRVDSGGSGIASGRCGQGGGRRRGAPSRYHRRLYVLPRPALFLLVPCWGASFQSGVCVLPCAIMMMMNGYTILRGRRAPHLLHLRSRHHSLLTPSLIHFNHSSFAFCSYIIHIISYIILYVIILIIYYKMSYIVRI